MVLTLGIRTIWIVIRGQNYARQALRQAGKDVDELIKKQQQLARQAQQLMFAGLMYMVFGAMVAMTMMRFIEMTSLGALYAEDFRRVLERVGIALGEAIIDNFGWAIEAFIGFLDALSKNDPIITFIATAGVLGGALLLLFGFFMILQGGVITLLGWLGVMPATIATIKAALGSLFGVLMFVIAGFMVGMQIGRALADVLGGPLTMAIGILIAVLVPLVAIIWSLATGTSIASFGLAAIAGIAAMGAGIALAGYMASQAQEAAAMAPAYQYGTRLVTSAGMAYVHPYETISRLERPILGAGPEQPSPQRIYDIDVQVAIGEVHTEAEIEELATQVSEKIAEKIDEQTGGEYP